jgi:hypothetical protein
MRQSWLRRLPRWIVVCVAAGLAAVCAVIAVVGIRIATADDTSGNAVPADVLTAVKTAARSCPSLSPPRLAGQLMATSKFNPKATTDFGGTGIAGLTAAAWARWAPSSTARRDDTQANVVALAHDMCDLVGELRVDNVAGDEWRNALGAYHSGIAAVTDAGGIPADAASYVDSVASYAAYYALRPEFGGPGTADLPGLLSSAPAPTASATPARAGSATPTPSTTAPTVAPTTAPTSPATTTPGATAQPVPPPHPTTAAPPPPVGHPIVGEESSRCLDVVGADHTSGAPVDIWDCAGGDNQKWVITSAGELRVYSGTRCLDAPSTASMTRVVVRSCDGSAGQKWSVNADRTITSVPSGECLDVTGYVTDNGTPLQIWPCNGASNERWNID